MQIGGVPIIALSSFSLWGFSEGTYFEILVGKGKLLLYGKKCPLYLCKTVGMKSS